MFRHLIAITSSYTLGTRIAWHYSAEKIDKSVFKRLKDESYKILSGTFFAVHKLSTESESWGSVIEKDSFFKDVKVIEELDEFLKMIKNDKKLSALDVAKYLLSVQSMSNLKLQKMIYFTYADYLIKTGRPLFEDDQIYAYQYGPVIPSVYKAYRKHGREEITYEDYEQVITLDEITVPMSLAKILQVDDEKGVLESIDRVMKKYGSKKAGDLVTLTHKEGSPWYRTFDVSNVITDDVIKKYHFVEE